MADHKTCAVCAKVIESEATPSLCINGMQIVPGLEYRSVAEREYVEAQFAPYPADRPYYVCVGCYLRALGVPEPVLRSTELHSEVKCSKCGHVQPMLGDGGQPLWYCQECIHFLGTFPFTPAEETETTEKDKDNGKE